MQDYEKLNKIEDIEERNALLKTIGTNNFNSAIYAAEAKQERKHTRDEIKKVCSDKGLLECETSGAPKGYKYEGYHNLSTLKDKSFDDGKSVCTICRRTAMILAFMLKLPKTIK